MELYNGDCLIELKKLANKSIDCVITDPPYFIDRMGNNWDVDKLKESAGKAKVVGSMPVGMKFDPEQGVALQ